jgi:sugar/nucleoside kinase (ribokinase family)
MVVGDLCLDIDVVPKGIFGSQREIDELYLCASGSAGNTAIALSQLGIQTDLISPVLEDRVFEIIKNILNNIPSLRVYRLESLGKSTGVIINIFSVRGVRKVYFYKGPKADNLKKIVEMLNTKNYELLHISGYFLELSDHDKILEIIEQAKNCKVLVSLDLFPRVHMLPLNTTFEVLNNVDILFGNLREFKSLEINSPNLIKKLLDKNVEAIVVKMGSKGAKTFMRSNEIKVASIRTKVKFLKGAGDVFVATYLKTFLENKDHKEALKKACEVASSHVAGKSPIEIAKIRLI